MAVTKKINEKYSGKLEAIFQFQAKDNCHSLRSQPNIETNFFPLLSSVNIYEKSKKKLKFLVALMK